MYWVTRNRKELATKMVEKAATPKKKGCSICFKMYLSNIRIGLASHPEILAQIMFPGNGVFCYLLAGTGNQNLAFA